MVRGNWQVDNGQKPFVNVVMGNICLALASLE